MAAAPAGRGRHRIAGPGTVAFAAALIALAVGGVPAAARPHPTLPSGEACITAQCHGRLLEAAAGVQGSSVHQLAADRDCAQCHDLTLPAAARFVKGAPVPGSERSEKERAWDLPLCGGCHGGELLAQGEPGATGFSDGKRNLHALHVQAGRGRRCLTCHDPHAARQPKLLRGRIPARGGASVTQQFRAEPSGGWCRTGCHAPKSYRRPPR